MALHLQTGPQHSLAIAVTSSNTEKLDAVAQAFESWFGADTPMDVMAHPSDSGIPHGQPWGLQHTFEGAMARLSAFMACALPSQTQWTHVVSVENGVCVLQEHKGPQAVDMCCVVVQNTATGERYVGWGPGRPYPLECVQGMARRGVSGPQIGQYCKEYYAELALPFSRGDQVSAAVPCMLLC